MRLRSHRQTSDSESDVPQIYNSNSNSNSNSNLTKTETKEIEDSNNSSITNLSGQNISLSQNLEPGLTFNIGNTHNIGDATKKISQGFMSPTVTKVYDRYLIIYYIYLFHFYDLVIIIISMIHICIIYIYFIHQKYLTILSHTYIGLYLIGRK
jgi:hypothetical protein